MKIFIKSTQFHSGMHRFLNGLLIDARFSIEFLNEIKESNNFSGDSAIFGGWLPQELLANTTFNKKYYTYCSPIGQADLSSQEWFSIEIRIFLDLLSRISSKEITGCICSDYNVSRNSGFIYVPPVILDETSAYTDISNRKNYGLLGNNSRKHRNVVNQMFAINNITPREDVIVYSVENYNLWGRLFGLSFISKDLKNDEDYFKEISSHRLGFVCSYSESFSYQALEYALCGVPCIVSPCINWYPVKECVVKNNDSFFEISFVAMHVLKKENYKKISDTLYESSRIFNKENKQFLQTIIDRDLK